ncbi:MAG: tRNA 4-thiouridine(8) synthase ThiI [Candidatus Thorarchaeota archaeon]|nr:tRNA 4-thiouridine(8) synthase ThiI [Candidatus Thorarchaeota archaeon]
MSQSGRKSTLVRFGQAEGQFRSLIALNPISCELGGIIMEPKYSAVLLRYGEIAIKSKQTRRRMEDMLVSNVRAALLENKIAFTNIRKEYGRVFIVTSEAERAAAIASRVFGVVSASPVVVIEAKLDKILDVGEAIARSHFQPDASFAVGGRRVGTHGFSSQEMRGKLGERILEGIPELRLSVDLTDPSQTIYVEVRNENAYLFTRTIEGVGGMPTGTQGKVVCTLSSGLDSPVAAFKAMKRGCVPVFVNFDNNPHSQDDCADVVIRQAQVLANYIYNHEVKLYIIPHGIDLTEAMEHGPKKMTCIFCKRNMIRMARSIAIIENADAIITGEIIGEQASQTTQNLRVISNAVCDFPILRPCVGDDKSEIEAVAQKIGTYEFARESLSCCSLAPRYPALAAKESEAQSAEQSMDLTVLDSQVASARILTLRNPGN